MFVAEPSLNRKAKGDLAELMVAADLRRRGYKLAFPYGEDCDFDLIVCRAEALERVQVKHARSDGHVIPVKCCSHSLTNGKVRDVKTYTSAMIEWLAVYDVTTDCCYYIPASKLGAGRRLMHLRLTPARSGRKADVHWASDYVDI